MMDGLTVDERILAIVTVFFGGVIIVGSIFYYGWKKRFPLKAKSVLHIEWVFLVVYGLGAIGLWYWYTNAILPVQQQHAQEQAQMIFDQAKQQQTQELQQQQSSLTDRPSTPFQADGFSIDIPSGWRQDTYGEQRWASFGHAKVWHTNDGNQELDVVWNTDSVSGKLNQLEDISLSDATGFPDKYALTHPAIAGVSKTQMTYDTKVYSDGYSIKLYAHANGKIYFIEGSLSHGTDAQAAALKQIILSFKLQ